MPVARARCQGAVPNARIEAQFEHDRLIRLPLKITQYRWPATLETRHSIDCAEQELTLADLAPNGQLRASIRHLAKQTGERFKLNIVQVRNGPILHIANIPLQQVVTLTGCLFPMLVT